MMVLLSIRKIYCDLILQGVKQFEFRKRLPKELKKGDQVALYCTQPTSRVVAYVDVADIIQATTNKLWKRTSFAAGIDHCFFSEYFGDMPQANAIQIGTIHKLRKPLSLEMLRGCNTPPQSYLYLSDEEARKVKTNTVVEERNLSIFVGGVHGVGKTTFINKVLSSLGFACFTASNLIKRHKLVIRKDKVVSDVAGNQTGLIIESTKESSKHRLYAIDGHFTLLSKERNVQPISIEVFSALKLDCLLLLCASCEEIQSRMSSRDGMKWPKALIRSFMREEERQAETVARKLHIPLLKLAIGDSRAWAMTKQFIQEIIANKFLSINENASAGYAYGNS